MGDGWAEESRQILEGGGADTVTLAGAHRVMNSMLHDRLVNSYSSTTSSSFHIPTRPTLTTWRFIRYPIDSIPTKTFKSGNRPCTYGSKREEKPSPPKLTRARIFISTAARQLRNEESKAAPARRVPLEEEVLKTSDALLQTQRFYELMARQIQR